MSIFFDFRVGPSGRKFRRAIDFDKYEIELLMDKKHTEAIFGEVNIGALIELATLSICLINEQRKVIGFLALHDRPNVPAVPASDWENWLRNMFRCNFLPHNTLFIHMMCCVEASNDSFLDEALRSVFNNDEYLQQVVLVAPPSCSHDDVSRYKPFRKHLIKKIAAKRADDVEHCIYVAHRDIFYPRLSVRAATEEDNDDIVEILDKLHPSMKKLYGDYYVSEIIGRHAESPRKIVVAQCQDQAVGVMCLNAKIDYFHLSKTYDLLPYFGLRKATGPEKEELRKTNSTLMAFGDPILRGKRNPFENSIDMSIRNSNESSRKKNKSRQRKISSHVFFKKSTAMRRSFDQFFFHKTKNLDDYSDKVSMGSRTSVAVSPYSSLLLDEDPFDYEIVNIDSNLLTVPNVPALTSSYVLWLEDSGSVTGFKSKKPTSSKKSTRLQKQAKLFNKPKNDNVAEEYHGDYNAFSIEIYALHEDIDERKGYGLLVAAFEIMNDYDYCLLRLPCDSSPMYLLRHFCFIPSKNKTCNEYALYIAHRSSVMGNLTVRKAEIVDIPQISKFIQSLDGKETIWVVENSILGKNQHEAYVFVCGINIVGFGVLEPPEQLDYLRAKFNMDSFYIQNYHYTGNGAYTDFAAIKTVLVYPVFEAHFRFFLREMMRLSGADSMVWLTGYRNKWVIHKANSIAAAMVPLMPRKSEPIWVIVPELQKIEHLSKLVMAFSSWLITTKLTSVSRLNIDTRIVVVGASRTAMGFINSLLFSDASSYLTFTNVTLVSTNGLPYARHLNIPESCAEMMFPRYRTTTEKYLKSTPYTYYLNLVQGTLVEINKQDKYIIISSGQRYYYDKLFLMIGKQFQHPDYLNAVRERERKIERGIPPSYTRLDNPSLREPQIDTSYSTPRNVFIVNTDADAYRALRQVKNIRRKKSEGKIIVYGSSLEVYCCIAALQEINVPANRIVFVEPFPPENPRKTRVSIFNNTNVDRTISEILDELGVTVLRSYYFQSWETDMFNVVTHASFLSHFQMVKLECAALFYYGTRDINADAFLAFHKSGLVYNDGILINHECRTKSPSIYAAGPATRYSARYFADMRGHQYYDSYEVGEKVWEDIQYYTAQLRI